MRQRTHILFYPRNQFRLISSSGMMQKPLAQRSPLIGNNIPWWGWNSGDNLPSLRRWHAGHSCLGVLRTTWHKNHNQQTNSEALHCLPHHESRGRVRKQKALRKCRRAFRSLTEPLWMVTATRQPYHLKRIDLGSRFCALLFRAVYLSDLST